MRGVEPCIHGSTQAPPAAWQGPEDSRHFTQKQIQKTASHTEFLTLPDMRHVRRRFGDAATWMYLCAQAAACAGASWPQLSQLVAWARGAGSRSVRSSGSLSDAMSRVAAHAFAAYTDPPDTLRGLPLADQLLRAALVATADGPFPCGLDLDSSSVELIVPLFDKASMVGALARLTVHRLHRPNPDLPTHTHNTNLSWVPAPASQLLQLDTHFQQALDQARRHLQQYVEADDAAPTRHTALVWDLQPYSSDHGPLLFLGGDSAGVAFLVAALWLMRDQLREQNFAQLLDCCDMQQVAISAALTDSPGTLAHVGAAVDKSDAVLATKQMLVSSWRRHFQMHVAYGQMDAAGVPANAPARKHVREHKSLTDLLQALAADGLDTYQTALLAALAQADTAQLGTLDEALLEPVAAKGPVGTLRAYQLWQFARHAVRRRGAHLHVDFVNLYMERVDEHQRNPGKQAGSEQRLPEPDYRSLDQLLVREGTADSYLIQGPAGCGKSTLLRRYEQMESLASLRRHLRKPPPQGKNYDVKPEELCLWVAMNEAPAWLADDADVGQLSPAAQSARAKAQAEGEPVEPLAWLRSRFAGVPELVGRLQRREDPAFAHVPPLRILLDGVNEISGEGSAGWTQTVQRMVAAIRKLPQDVALPPILSTRTVKPIHVHGSTPRKVQVLPWQASEMIKYCQLRGVPDLMPYLQPGGKQHHVDLFQLCQIPLYLAYQCDLFQDSGLFATRRADLFCATLWRMIRDAYSNRTHPLHCWGLLAEHDLRMLQSFSFSGGPTAWRDLPREGALLRGLQGVGHAMWRQSAQLKPDETGRISIPEPLQVPGLRDDEVTDLSGPWLKAAEALGLTEPWYQGSKRWLRFRHQLWGEFFAGLGMLAGPHDAATLQRLDEELREPVQVPLREDWEAARKEDRSLYPLKTAAGEESVRFAIQLQSPEDAAKWVRRLMGINLPLAGRAAAEVHDTLQQATPDLLQSLRQALLQGATDERVEPDYRKRVALSDALGLVGDTLRFEEHTVPGTNHRFRLPRDGADARRWLPVAGGKYLVGAEDIAWRSEGPPTLVRVCNFEVAFAHLTYSEFECFTQAGGYDAPDWWPEGPARQWQQMTDRRQGPSTVGRRGLGLSLQPVTGISFWEAQAYCRWLTATTTAAGGLRYVYAVPLEAEWAVVLQCWPGREPVGGLQDWSGLAAYSYSSASALNHRTTRLGRPSLGNFPAGDRRADLANQSAGTLLDPAGSVSIWTRSAFTERLERTAMQTESGDPAVDRAVWGYGWHQTADNGGRAAHRMGSSPRYDYYAVGVRLVRYRAAP